MWGVVFHCLRSFCFFLLRRLIDHSHISGRVVPAGLINTHKHTHTYTHTNTHTHRHKHTHAQTHKHTRIHTQTHTYAHTHAHTHTRTHTNTHTHTHTLHAQVSQVAGGEAALA